MGFCSSALILFLVVTQMSAVVQCPFPPPLLSPPVQHHCTTRDQGHRHRSSTGPGLVLSEPPSTALDLRTKEQSTCRSCLPRSYRVQPRVEILQSDHIPACAMRYTHADYLTVGTISIQMAVESTCSDRNGIGQS
ncbi:hypothetical protein VTI28DRAFT_346 [Corynascus sepedonium]